MSELPKEISWDLKKAAKFKKTYADSQRRPVEIRDKVFKFEGYEFIPGYAKYLIEYLDNELNED